MDRRNEVRKRGGQVAREGPQDTNDELYTTTQAAQVLGVDWKTLRRRMKQGNVEPLQSPEDKRVRMLTGAQIAQLQSLASRTAKVPRAETPLGEATKAVKSLDRRLTKLEERLTDEIQKHDAERARLEEELKWRMDDWKRTSAFMMSMLVLLQDELSHDKASSPSNSTAPNNDNPDTGLEDRLNSNSLRESAARLVAEVLSTVKQN